MNILEAQFTTEQAAGASGAGFENLQNWMKRGKVAGMERIAGGGAKGRHRRFSFHSVMEIAVVVDLRRVGYSDLDHAFRAATTFAHFAGPDFNVSKERWPGCPWSGPGKTLLMIGPDSYSIEYVDLAAPAARLWTTMQQCGGGCTMIDLGLVFNRVVAALGFPLVDVRAALVGEDE